MILPLMFRDEASINGLNKFSMEEIDQILGPRPAEITGLKILTNAFPLHGANPQGELAD